MVTINVRQKGCLKGWGDVCSGPWKPSPGAYHEEEREAGHGVDQQQEPPDGPNVRLVLAHLGLFQLSLWPLFLARQEQVGNVLFTVPEQGLVPEGAPEGPPEEPPG